MASCDLKGGRAYVPMDPEYRKGRLAYILAELPGRGSC